MGRKISLVYSMPFDEFSDIVGKSSSLKDVLRRIGFVPTSGTMLKKVKDRINKDNIDISHFKKIEQFWEKQYSLDEILIENSKYSNRCRLKKRLVSEGRMEYKCVCCGNVGVWNGKKLNLQLDHINGIYNDNRIENLRLICPNCHSQTDTFSGKNISSSKDKKK